jgi:hypothetical protein
MDIPAFTPSSVTKIHSSKILPEPAHALRVYRVGIDYQSLWDSVQQGLHGSSRGGQLNSNPMSAGATFANNEQTARSVCVWLPAPIVEMVLPTLVGWFVAVQSKRCKATQWPAATKRSTKRMTSVTTEATCRRFKSLTAPSFDAVCYFDHDRMMLC